MIYELVIEVDKLHIIWDSRWFNFLFIHILWLEEGHMSFYFILFNNMGKWDSNF